MAKEIVGYITCPHCGNDQATVHKQAKGGKFYYRCYASEGSVDARCGTVQITGPTGQSWIKSAMKPISTEPEPQPVDHPKGSETPPEPPKNPKGSIAGAFSSWWKEEDAS